MNYIPIAINQSLYTITPFTHEIYLRDYDNIKSLQYEGIHGFIELKHHKELKKLFIFKKVNIIIEDDSFDHITYDECFVNNKKLLQNELQSLQSSQLLPSDHGKYNHVEDDYQGSSNHSNNVEFQIDLNSSLGKEIQILKYISLQHKNIIQVRDIIGVSSIIAGHFVYLGRKQNELH